METIIKFLNIAMMSSNINTAGLIMDIFGVVGLFVYGLPPSFLDDGTLVIGTARNPNHERKKKRFERYSWASLVLIVTGFLLQALSNYV